MFQTEIYSTLITADPLRFHLISGENYCGRFTKDEQTGYISLIGTSVSFPIWAIKRIQQIL